MTGAADFEVTFIDSTLKVHKINLKFTSHPFRSESELSSQCSNVDITTPVSEVNRSLNRQLANFLSKKRIISDFRFAGPVVSVAATQLENEP